jgi:hypothetical protein
VGAVGVLECLPSERARKGICVGEDTTADDQVARRVEFEQKHLTWLECAKIGSRWRPEVHLVEVLMTPQHLEPITIGYGDYEVEAALVH